MLGQFHPSGGDLHPYILTPCPLDPVFNVFRHSTPDPVNRLKINGFNAIECLRDTQTQRPSAYMKPKPDSLDEGL